MDSAFRLGERAVLDDPQNIDEPVEVVAIGEETFNSVVGTCIPGQRLREVYPRTEFFYCDGEILNDIAEHELSRA